MNAGTRLPPLQKPRSISSKFSSKPGKKILPSIAGSSSYASSSYHGVVDVLEESCGRTVSFNEILKHVSTEGFGHTSTGRKTLTDFPGNQIDANLDRATKEVGDGWTHWKPEDYLVEDVEEAYRSLGDDFQTNGINHPPPSLETAQLHRKSSMFRRGETTVKQTCSKSIKQLNSNNALGSGMILHFLLYKYMGFALLMLCVINFPTILLACTVGNNGLEGRLQGSVAPNGILSTCSIGNVALFDKVDTVQRTSVAAIQNSSLQEFVNTTKAVYLDSKTAYYFNGANVSRTEAHLTIIVADIISFLGLVFTALLYKERVRKEYLRQKANISASDYSVYVSNLPVSATKHEVVEHFNYLYRLDEDDWSWPGWCCGCTSKTTREKENICGPPVISYDLNGEEIEILETIDLLPVKNVNNSCDEYFKDMYVCDATIVHPTSHLLRMYRETKKISRKLMHARAMWKYYSAREKEMGDVAEDKVGSNDWGRKASELKRAYNAHQSRFVQTMKQSRANQDETRGAFIIFNHEESMKRCLNDYNLFSNFFGRPFQPRPLRFKGRYPISVVQADNPENINWENIDTSSLSIVKRRTISTLAKCILLLITFALKEAIWVTTLSHRSVGLSISLTNAALVRSISKFVIPYERHHSARAESLATSSAVIVAVTVNTLVLPHINVQSDANVATVMSRFGSMWYVTTGACIIYSVVFSILIALLLYIVEIVKGVFRRVKRGPQTYGWPFGKLVTTQDELNERYSGWDWKIEMVLPVSLSFMVVCISCSSGFPVLYLVCLIGCAVMYFVDKFMLVHAAKQPTRYNECHARFSAETVIPIAIALKLLVGVWLHSINNADNNVAIPWYLQTPTLVYNGFALTACVVAFSRRLRNNFLWFLGSATIFFCKCAAGIGRDENEITSKYLPGFTEILTLVPCIFDCADPEKDTSTWDDLTPELRKDGWVVEESDRGWPVRCTVFTSTTSLLDVQHPKGTKMRTWEYIIMQEGGTHSYDPKLHPKLKDAFEKMKEITNTTTEKKR